MASLTSSVGSRVALDLGGRPLRRRVAEPTACLCSGSGSGGSIPDRHQVSNVRSDKGGAAGPRSSPSGAHLSGSSSSSSTPPLSAAHSSTPPLCRAQAPGVALPSLTHVHDNDSNEASGLNEEDLRLLSQLAVLNSSVASLDVSGASHATPTTGDTLGWRLTSERDDGVRENKVEGGQGGANRAGGPRDDYAEHWQMRDLAEQASLLESLLSQNGDGGRSEAEGTTSHHDNSDVHGSWESCGFAGEAINRHHSLASETTSLDPSSISSSSSRSSRSSSSSSSSSSGSNISSTNRNEALSIRSAISSMAGSSGSICSDDDKDDCSSKLQVLSDEEEAELSAKPIHPAALKALYFSHFLSCFGEHAWRFISPAVLSVMHHSLLPVAVASFVSQLVTFLCAPWVGEMMDSTPRVFAFKAICSVQTAAMIVAALATVYGLNHPPATLSAGALLFQPWFLLLVAAGAIDKVAGLASGVAFERDWVILLAGQNRPLALASANAVLRRVDLFCEIAGPMAFGWLLSALPPLVCMHAAMAVTLVSLPLLVVLVHTTDRLSKGALRRPRSVEAQEQQGAAEPSGPQQPLLAQQQNQQEQEAVAVGAVAASVTKAKAPKKGTGPFDAAIKGWRCFLKQPVLPASLAYILLYFNAVLSPGGLMTSFLTQRGVDVSVIGMFRGACAAMGFAATFVSAPLVAGLGVLQAGAAALIFQSAALAVCVGIYYVSPAHNKGLLLVFLAMVVLSRLGLWTYDVIDAQIFQTAVPSSQANLVGTTEVALASLAELIMLGAAIVIHDVAHFGRLATLSMASVFGATVLYCMWLAKPDAVKTRLFPCTRPWQKWFVWQQEEDSDEAQFKVGSTHEATPLPAL